VIPFWLPKVVALGAGAVFLFSADARPWAKGIVLLTLLVSFFLEYGIRSPATWAVALVLQVAVCLVVLLHFRLYR
jgi:hypothetical protein